jgi:hypothetical protein
VGKMLVLDDGCTLVTGSKDSEVFKESFPIPRQHSQQTAILPFNDFSTEEHRISSRCVALLQMAQTLFVRGEYIKAAKLLCTFNGIGWGGDIKFISYHKMFFLQLFQYTLPSGSKGKN